MKIQLPDISLSILEAIEHNVTHNAGYPLFSYETESGGVEEISWGRAGTAFAIAATSILNDLRSSANPLSPIGIIANLGA